MTIEELYEQIGGDYEQAKRVLRMDKLIDKHIRKLATNAIIDALIAAGDALDPTAMFEAAHAVKGYCANLGLTRIADLASELSEEYRPGNPRKMSDEEVREKLDEVRECYRRAVEGVEQYESALN